MGGVLLTLVVDGDVQSVRSEMTTIAHVREVFESRTFSESGVDRSQGNQAEMALLSHLEARPV